jgi:hypothetical protein
MCLVFSHVQILMLLFAANDYRLCVVCQLMVHGWVPAFSRRLIFISILKMTILLNLKLKSRIEEIITQPVPQPNSG